MPLTKCQRIAGYAHDALTIAMSVTDIVCDVLVAKEFYDAGRLTYFHASLAIFALAQCAYAVRMYDGTDGCMGDYFFYESAGYCACERCEMALPARTRSHVSSARALSRRQLPDRRVHARLRERERRRHWAAVCVPLWPSDCFGVPHAGWPRVLCLCVAARPRGKGKTEWVRVT